MWALELPGGGPGRTVRDVRALLERTDPAAASPALRALFGLRRALGRLFGWDGPEEGGLAERFRTRFESDAESIAEIRNATVHAFLVYALEPREAGYRLHWAIHVKPVGWITPWYMRLIDPFRRWIVYPSLLGRLKRDWEREYGPG